MLGRSIALVHFIGLLLLFACVDETLLILNFNNLYLCFDLDKISYKINWGSLAIKKPKKPKTMWVFFSKWFFPIKRFSAPQFNVIITFNPPSLIVIFNKPLNKTFINIRKTAPKGLHFHFPKTYSFEEFISAENRGALHLKQSEKIGWKKKVLIIFFCPWEILKGFFFGKCLKPLGFVRVLPFRFCKFLTIWDL